MKYIKLHPIIKEGLDLKSSIETLQDINDIFINLQDEFDVEITLSLFKFEGVKEIDPENPHSVEKYNFGIYNIEGVRRDYLQLSNEYPKDSFRVVFSGEKMEIVECRRLHEYIKNLINQTESLTGLKLLGESSALALVNTRDYESQIFGFDQNIGDVDMKVEKFTGIVIFN
jgi:hypothetical protein